MEHDKQRKTVERCGKNEKKIRGSSYYTRLQGESKTDRLWKNASDVALLGAEIRVRGISVNKEDMVGVLKPCVRRAGQNSNLCSVPTWRDRVGRELGREFEDGRNPCIPMVDSY